jgi:hypothetical protein
MPIRRYHRFLDDFRTFLTSPDPFSPEYAGLSAWPGISEGLENGRASGPWPNPFRAQQRVLVPDDETAPAIAGIESERQGRRRFRGVRIADTCIPVVRKQVFPRHSDIPPSAKASS